MTQATWEEIASNPNVIGGKIIVVKLKEITLTGYPIREVIVVRNKVLFICGKVHEERYESFRENFPTIVVPFGCRVGKTPLGYHAYFRGDPGGNVSIIPTGGPLDPAKHQHASFPPKTP